jgi:putative DNA primase/helicase
MTDIAEGLAYKIAEALGSSLVPDAGGNYMCTCPAHDDHSPSFAVRDSDLGLLVHCFAGCAYADIMAALQRLKLLPEGVTIAADDVSSGEDAPAEEKDGEAEPAEDLAEAATKTRAEETVKKLAVARWRFSVRWQALDGKSALHATVDAYLNWQGVTHFETAPTWLRFAPSCLHIGHDKSGARFDQFFPALIVAGENPTTGELYGGQFEYLAYGGRGFAPVDKKLRKKTAFGTSLKGAVARIAEPVEGEFLLVGESWVTVKTVMDATGLPGWSVFGTAGLTSFAPPASVTAVLFLGENDADGKNAKALAVICPELFKHGIKIGVAKPPPGLSDFNELVRERDDKTRLHGTVEAGLKVVRDIIEKAKLKAVAKDATAGAAPGAPMPLIDLPGMDGEDDAKTFSMTRSGLFRGRMFVCQAFEVVAQSRIITDGRATDWGLRIRFKNPDGAGIEEPIATRDLYGEPTRLSAELASLGMDINNSAAAKSALAAYLGSTKVKDRVLIATRTGWAMVHGKTVFVLPNHTIGAGSERVILAGDGRTVVYAQAGMLAEWKQHIGNPAGAHVLLQFGIAVGFSGALLQISGSESGGFHLHEFSSKGKTTAQQVVASIWGSGALKGGFIRRWRATANSLEATFAAADTCLLLDEMSQAGYGEVAAIVYSVTGEVGKGRLRSDATSRTAYSWRTTIFSSGETPSAARIDEDRFQKGGRSKELRGGATVRLIDIPADREFGAFDRPAGELDFSPAAFAERLQEMASIYYGTAGPAFVKTMLDEEIGAAAVRQGISDFTLSVLADAANDKGQLRRVARRFGLVATAGLMAISAGIVDWDPDVFVEGVRGLFRSWATARGAGRSIEAAQILAIARSYFSRHGESHFDSIDETPDLVALRERPAVNRSGYRTGQGPTRRWFVFPQVWKEIFAGINPHKAAAVLYKVAWWKQETKAAGALTRG